MLDVGLLFAVLLIAAIVAARSFIVKRRSARREWLLAASTELNLDIWDSVPLEPPYDFPIFKLGKASVLLGGSREEARVYIAEMGGAAQTLICRITIAIVEDAALDLPAFLIARSTPHDWIDTGYLIPYPDPQADPDDYVRLDECLVVKGETQETGFTLSCNCPDRAERVFDAEVQAFLKERVRDFSVISGEGQVFFAIFYTAIEPEELTAFGRLALDLHALLVKDSAAAS